MDVRTSDDDVMQCRLFAAFEYTFETADLRVANTHFDELAAEYSCGQFVTKVGGGGASGIEMLVVKDTGQGGVLPNGSSSCKYGHNGMACNYKDLIDWLVCFFEKKNESMRERRRRRRRRRYPTCI